MDETIKNVITAEAAELINFAENLPPEIKSAVNLLKERRGGRVICTGMGKSGHIAKKVSATLMSTGTPSAFLHPAEAIHGDLGMVLSNSTLLAFSNSGETEEIIRILPFFIDNNIPVVSILGNKTSTLAKASEVAVAFNIEREACPHNLAPTSSTTLSLAIGDAIAICLMREQQFQPIDFARFHPGGSLGKKLIDNVSKHLRACPTLDFDTSCVLASKMLIASNALIGAVMKDNHLVGAITLGDITRAIATTEDFSQPVNTFMSENPKWIHDTMPCSEADKVLEELSVGTLIVLDSSSNVIGFYSK